MHLLYCCLCCRVGIGVIHEAFLKEIASEESKCFIASSFDQVELQELADEAAAAICSKGEGALRIKGHITTHM